MLCYVRSGIWALGSGAQGHWALGSGVGGSETLGLWVLGSGWHSKTGQNGSQSVQKWHLSALGAVWRPLSELLVRS